MVAVNNKPKKQHMKFTITRPTPSALLVTGAALRSVQAADAAAIAAYDALDRAAELVCAAFGGREDTLDASRMASIFEALGEFRRCSKQVEWPGCKLAQRWSRSAVAPVFTSASSCHDSHKPDVYGLESHAIDAAYRLKTTLTRAGVPMPDSDHTTAQYWRDAAARGC